MTKIAVLALTALTTMAMSSAAFRTRAPVELRPSALDGPKVTPAFEAHMIAAQNLEKKIVGR